MSEAVFELNNISYAYFGKIPALCGINLEILKGEKIAVVGANGSGKSTFLQLLDGLIFADEGQITAFGKRLNETVFTDPEFSKYFRSKVGLLFQNPDVQLFCPTVKEDILFGPLQLDMEEAGIRKSFASLCALLNLEDLLNRAPYHLSVGEKRKVAIASTLIIEPQVLLLDEPTAGLDPATTRHIIDIILDYHQKGRTVITATQDLHIVEEIADTVYVFGMDKKIAGSGPAREILSDRGFLKKHNLIHIHSHRHKDKIHIHPHEHLESHHEE